MQTSPDMTNQVLVAIIGSGFFGYVVSRIFDDIRAWIKAKREHPFHTILPKIHSVYSILNILLREIGCQRIMIIKTENGGGKPKLGGQLYATVLYESFDYPLRALKPSYQRELLDSSHVDLLYNLDINSHINRTTEEMSSGFLKDLYLSTDVKNSQYFKIHESETRYIHLCINYTKDIEFDEVKTKVLIAQSVAALKKLFEAEENL